MFVPINIFYLIYFALLYFLFLLLFFFLGFSIYTKMHNENNTISTLNTVVNILDSSTSLPANKSDVYLIPFTSYVIVPILSPSDIGAFRFSIYVTSGINSCPSFSSSVNTVILSLTSTSTFLVSFEPLFISILAYTESSSKIVFDV